MSAALTQSVLFAACACVLTLLLGRLVMAYGPKDKPDGARKNQAKAMPTSGGIAIFVSVMPLTVFALFMNADWFTFPLGALLGGSVYMFLMGVWDDILALRATPKLVVQILIAGGVAWFGIRVSFFDAGRHMFEIGMLFGLLGSAAWLVVVTNAVNFMDGSDGLAMGSAAVIAAALALFSALSGTYNVMCMSLILLGALLGHLFWNGRGKLFTGDSGSLFVGFYLAGLVLYWVELQRVSIWVAPLLFVAFLTDVLLTLVWRYKHGRSLMTPHNEHIYQILLRSGVSQMLTAWIFVWVTMHGALFAGVSLLFPIGGAMISFVILLAILYYLHRKIRGSAVRNGILDPKPQ